MLAAAPSWAPSEISSSRTRGPSVDEKTSSMAGVLAQAAATGPARHIRFAQSLLVPRRARNLQTTGRLEWFARGQSCPYRGRHAGPLAVGAYCRWPLPDSVDPHWSRNYCSSRQEDRVYLLLDT